MKKIVALVLSLVMVLGLATTAFAAANEYDMYAATSSMNAMLALGKPTYTNQTFEEVAANTNLDGSGNVAYLVNKDAANPAGAPSYWVKTATPTTESFAVTYEGKTDVLFYVDKTKVQDKGIFYYAGSATAFDKFSTFDKCGYATVTPGADDVYFQTAASAALNVAYLAAATTGTVQTSNYLLDGEVVTIANSTGVKVVDHHFVANNYVYDTAKKVNVPTSALCTYCLETSSVIYKDGKVPAGTAYYELYEGNATTGYSVVVAAAAPSTPAGDKVESAETFDAGIAMYVGMSVMAAAGSAVVLKKKD